MRYRYFTDSDFKKAVPSCSIDDMSSVLLKKLDWVRFYAGIPIRINSAFRSVDYEISKGRSGTSSHCKGLAVDIACKSSSDRQRILTAILNSGFQRVGIAKTFIHVDIDSDKPVAIWLY